MPVEISVRDLRNDTAAVVRRVTSGERLVLTVNHHRVADIVPHAEAPDPWVSAQLLRDFLERSGADQGLLTDLADVRGALVEP